MKNIRKKNQKKKEFGQKLKESSIKVCFFTVLLDALKYEPNDWQNYLRMSQDIYMELLNLFSPFRDVLIKLNYIFITVFLVIISRHVSVPFHP